MRKVPRPRVVAKQHLADLDLPAQVTLSLAELARAAKEHLLSLSVALGLATLQELFAEELSRLVGPKGTHQADRGAYRHGSERRFVTLGGRRVEVGRPRARSRAGRELPLATYAAVADRDLLGEAALQRMLAGLSSRRYRDGLEPIGDVRSRGTGRSAVSRRFVAGTAAKLAQLRSRDLSTLRLLALFIDGIQIAGRTIVVALGVDATGAKHVLGLWEGTTENAAVCTALLSDLIARGLATDRALLFVTDGGKAIAKAIRDTYGQLALHHRCRFHISAATSSTTCPRASGRWSAASSIRPGAGLIRTRPSARSGVSPILSRRPTPVRPPPGPGGDPDDSAPWALAGAREDLQSTNPIESLNDDIRHVERNVKRWRSGKMALRWTAAAALEREKRFRRINGYRDLWLLERALDRHTKEVTSSTTAA